MEQSLKTPEQLLVFKPLKQVLAAKPPVRTRSHRIRRSLRRCS